MCWLSSLIRLFSNCFVFVVSSWVVWLLLLVRYSVVVRLVYFSVIVRLGRLLFEFMVLWSLGVRIIVVVYLMCVVWCDCY